MTEPIRVQLHSLRRATVPIPCRLVSFPVTEIRQYAIYIVMIERPVQVSIEPPPGVQIDGFGFSGGGSTCGIANLVVTPVEDKRLLLGPSPFSEVVCLVVSFAGELPERSHQQTDRRGSRPTEMQPPACRLRSDSRHRELLRHAQRRSPSRCSRPLRSAGMRRIAARSPPPWATATAFMPVCRRWPWWLLTDAVRIPVFVGELNSSRSVLRGLRRAAVRPGRSEYPPQTAIMIVFEISATSDMASGRTS